MSRLPAFGCVGLAALLTVPIAGQQPQEMSIKDAPVVFRSSTSLIPVPVVIRDTAGKAVGNLNAADFVLFDNGKPQAISKFTVEALSAPSVSVAPAPAAREAVTRPLPEVPDGIPDRFIAYLFDDLHLELGDLVPAREAARKKIDAMQRSKERVGIFTTSGRITQEFTGDLAKLHAALDAVTASSATAAKSIAKTSCPPVDFYMADRIYNEHELTAWKIAAMETNGCLPGATGGQEITEQTISNCEATGSSDGPCRAIRMAKEAARETATTGDRDTEATLQTVQALVSRMSAMPGKRNLVLISPGFLVLNDRHDEVSAIIERAIRSSVVIGGIDARGLEARVQGGEASEHAYTAGDMIMAKLAYQKMATLSQTDAMANLADGTGGNFYHGTNDYDEGMTKVAATPDYLYVLAFAPQNLKLDGSFHNLKVTLRNGLKYDVQARKGYFAARYSESPSDQGARQVEEAFFSREEIRDLPAALQTQYFRSAAGEATLSASTRIDVRKLAFHREGDRNRNDLTVVTGVFDDDGNYVAGHQKILEMRLLDQTLSSRLGQGITVKESFGVGTGRYMVRVIVRDSEGKTMSALSSTVDIP